MTRRQALFLCHRIPYPPDKGDKIRSWRLLRHLAGRFDLHLACFVDDPTDMQHAPVLRDLCASATLVPLTPRVARVKSLRALLQGEPLSFAYFEHPEMRAAVDALRASRPAAEIAFSSSMAQYLEPVGARDKCVRIVDFCDADAEKWRAYATNASFPMQQIFAREGRLLAARETEIANWADASFAVSADEAAVFNTRGEIVRAVEWWGNGVDADYFDPGRAYEEPKSVADIVFVGAMDYRANVDAMTSFCASVWPRVRAVHPNATLAIVGANPTTRIKALDGRNGVSVTGRVNDVRPWLAFAHGVVAPLQVARGVQNKVLEAMAMAKPVIATPAAATGIQFSASSLAICHDGDAMAAAVNALLSGSTIANGRQARGDVVAHHSWDAQIERLSARLTALGV